MVVGEKTFHFDHVFDTFSQQIQLYDDVVSSLMDRFLEGFNATILAYGQVRVPHSKVTVQFNNPRLSLIHPNLPILFLR